MKQFIEDIEDIFKSAFAKAGYDESYGVITVSKRADLCEYQCNGCMSAAKAYKKKPIDIAGEVIQQIGDDPAFEKVEAVMPGFINITVSGGALAQKLSGMAKDECFGFEKEENPKTVVIDYGGANVAKPLHVGHLRSAVIGESVKRIISHAGNKTIGDVHLGDWGLQMGLIIEQLKDDDFYKIHQAYVINLANIKRISGYSEVIMCNGVTLPISSRNAPGFKKAYMDYTNRRIAK